MDGSTDATPHIRIVPAGALLSARENLGLSVPEYPGLPAADRRDCCLHLTDFRAVRTGFIIYETFAGGPFLDGRAKPVATGDSPIRRG